jgi:programmed cell death 6-interacting protein
MPSAQHVMLAIHCKRTDNVEIKNPVLSYVRETYGDRDADEALDDLVAIQNQRNSIVVAQSGSAGASKDSLVKCAGFA